MSSSVIERKTSTDSSDAKFPANFILPKQESEASSFLTKYPHYDGRGVIVAIMDTGVDPASKGLQITPDKKPKILDIVDGSGSGDVDTSTVVELDMKSQNPYQIVGLSGRTLSLNPKWTNPSNKYHLGVKAGYELFPNPLVERLQKERKQQWAFVQAQLETKILQQITELESSIPTSSSVPSSSSSADKKKEKAELESQINELRAMNKNYSDPGPLYDCVVFHDGKCWRAAIDTQEQGQIHQAKLLTNYRDEREYDTFSLADMLTYSVNIYDQGNVLSIVTNVSSHGTHVAGIVGAYFPDNEEMNGVAPGCQLVSIKISDSRIKTMETGTAMVRGLISVLENKCDLVNMSFGEPTSKPNVGRFCELASELVNKHGVIFVSSAGNNGPALSTVGAPGGTTSALIGVGAYVSPGMMDAEYSMRKQLPETQYTWSSRGPTYDGHLGVCVAACGGAIASVPRWTLQQNQLMNGTSMSSPNACAAIALILSALKQQNIPYTPQRIRRALENTARPISNVDKWAQGAGLLQVTKCYDHLIKYAKRSDEDILLKVSLPRRNNARGLYLREPHECNRVFETLVSIDPVFKQYPVDQSQLQDRLNLAKVDFQTRINIVSTVEWCSAPRHLVLMAGGRTFSIKVDPTSLKSDVHYGEIMGYDSEASDRGPIFRVPITVVKHEPPQSTASSSPPSSPISSSSSSESKGENKMNELLASASPYSAIGKEYHFENIKFTPGHIVRKFIVVPHDATWIDVVVKGKKIDTSRLFVVHLLYLIPQKSFRYTQLEKTVTLVEGAEENFSMKVVEGTTLEVVVAQNWNSLGESVIDYDLIFHGVSIHEKNIHLSPNKSRRVDIFSGVSNEFVNPSALLNVVRRTAKPVKSEIKPLSLKFGNRDILPENKQIHQLILTYEWEAKEKGEVVPRIPSLNRQLYESNFEAQLWMLFDSRKKFVGAGDAWPKKVKVTKGKYILRVQLRHDNLSLLENQKELNVVFDFKLSKAISVTTSISSKMMVRYGDRVPLYISPPPFKNLGKSVESGDVLRGRLILANQKASKSSFHLPLHYTVGILPKKEKKEESEDEDKKLESDPALQLRDIQIAHLSKLKGEKQTQAYNIFANDLLSKYPTHLPLLCLRLSYLTSEVNSSSPGIQRGNPEDVIDAANSVLQQIDKQQLASHFGKQTEDQSKRKEMEKLKSTLIDALAHKARALIILLNPFGVPVGTTAEKGETKSETKSLDDSKKKEFEKEWKETIGELKSWVSFKHKANQAKYRIFHVYEHILNQEFGNALKLINLQLSSKENATAYVPSAMPPTVTHLFEPNWLCLKLLERFEWRHWMRYQQVQSVIDNPMDFQIF